MSDTVKKKLTAAKLSDQVAALKKAFDAADCIIVGAGAGLSTAAGFVYDGERFRKHFADFAEKYGFSDMYSGGFYPYATPEEFWAFWSRNIYINRFENGANPLYQKLLTLVKDKDYFVITTNVDHQFQAAGFDKKRLFYTQGDYGLFQCSKPCCEKTYDNEETIRQMVQRQKNMRVPTELIPHCPICQKTMSLNLRSDDTFVEDAGWHAAAERYRKYLATHLSKKILFMDLGTGYNTPGIIKYPFWRMTMECEEATLACINIKDTDVPAEIADKSLCIAADIGAVIDMLTKE